MSIDNTILADESISSRLHGRVLVITGAGVSAESGIPTFRGAGGLWRNLDPSQLATPEAFERDPALVWTWYDERRRGIRAARPNPAHRAVAALTHISRDHLVVTQNVDDLHERGGSPPDRVVHVHGDIFLTRCARCPYSTHDDIAVDPPPRCPRCGSLCRPGVVWFGEALNAEPLARVEEFLATPVDVVLLVGTTAVFGYIVDWATRSGLLVEINPDETAASARADRVVRAPAGQALPLLLALP
jgi:NAD-dependent deacetylase